MAEIRELIKEYLADAKLMQLATVRDGQPWVCSVWFAADEDLNLYWFSAISRRHSYEVAGDPRVAGAIALPHSTADKPRGIQFEGTGRLLTSDEDVSTARNLYEGRIFDAATIDNFINYEERPHRFYRARPTAFVLFDTVNYPENPRQIFELAKT